MVEYKGIHHEFSLRVNFTFRSFLCGTLFKGSELGDSFQFNFLLTIQLYFSLYEGQICNQQVCAEEECFIVVINKSSGIIILLNTNFEVRLCIL